MNLTCHECNGDECTVKTLYKCSEAFACFSVKSSSNYYVNSLKKGCLYDLDNVRLFCNLTKPKAPFPMRCCSSNLCNNDSFVSMQRIAIKSKNVLNFFHFLGAKYFAKFI